MPIISCHLMGGLGNQMFQIAATTAYALDNGAEAVFPFTTDLGCSRKKSYTDSVLKKTKRDDLNKLFSKTTTVQLNENGSVHAYARLPSLKEIFSSGTVGGNVYLNGYFQSHKYFEKHSDVIKNLFDDENEKELLKIKYFLLDQLESLSIHVRRGDYVHLQDVHYNLPISYYANALNVIKENSDFETRRVFIFSDDIEWCKNSQFFSSIPNVVFVDEDEVVSLYLMSMCTHHIIANSTFSWWGAYLSGSKNVVMPSKWFGPKGPQHNVEDMRVDGWRIIS